MKPTTKLILAIILLIIIFSFQYYLYEQSKSIIEQSRTFYICAQINHTNRTVTDLGCEEGHLND